jgi:hypothetical protein
VLDALDECIDSVQVLIILDLLATEFGKLPFPVLLFITSRPEFHLESKFNSLNRISSSIRLHEIDRSIVTLDITITSRRGWEKLLPCVSPRPELDPGLIEATSSF